MLNNVPILRSCSWLWYFISHSNPINKGVQTSKLAYSFTCYRPLVTQMKWSKSYVCSPSIKQHLLHECSHLYCVSPIKVERYLVSQTRIKHEPKNPTLHHEDKQDIFTGQWKWGEISVCACRWTHVQAHLIANCCGSEGIKFPCGLFSVRRWWWFLSWHLPRDCSLLNSGFSLRYKLWLW